MILETRKQIKRDQKIYANIQREIQRSPLQTSRPGKSYYKSLPEQISNVESWEPLPAQHVGGIPEINHISRDHDGKSWEEIEITVDSGAAATVMPPEMCTYVPIDKNTNANTKFRAANGSVMQNEGMRALKGVDENLNPMGFHTHVAGVNKFLASVSKLTEAGHRVEFDEETGHRIINKRTGMVRYMRKQNGVFKMPMWVEVKDNPLSSVLKSESSNVTHKQQSSGSGPSNSSNEPHMTNAIFTNITRNDGWSKVQGTFRPQVANANVVDYTCPFQWQALDF